MSHTGVHIDFNAPAILRTWLSLNSERISASVGPRPYLVVDRSLDECIGQFQSVRHSASPLRDSHRAANCCAPVARCTGSRHCSFGFNQWML
jgi:hypothetical protein